MILRKSLLILLASFFLTGLTGCSNTPSLCDTYIKTAEDKEKTSYLKKWINENIDNKEIWAEMDAMGVIERRHNQNPITFWKKIKLDWDYLGLRKLDISMANIRFYLLDKQNGNYSQSDNVKAIGFGIGLRNSIIIKLGSSEIPNTAIFTERELRSTTKISDNVLVICTND